MNSLDQVQPTQDDIESAVQGLAKEQSRIDMVSTLDSAIDVNPDAEAKVQQLAKKASMPVELVRGREADVERDLQLDQKRMDGIVEKFPVLTESLKNEDFASITHDELDKLALLEDQAPRLMAGNSTIYQETLARFEQQGAYIAMMASAYGIGDDSDLADIIVARSMAAAKVEDTYPGYVRKYMQQAQMNKGFFGQAGAAIDNPRAFTRVTGAQIPSTMAIPIATAAGGAGLGTVAAPGVGTAVGGVGGLFTGSAFVGVSTELGQALAERGVDTTDRAAVLAAISAPEFKSEIRARAEKYGLTMAAVDTMFAGVAGKLTNASRGASTARRVGAVAGDIGIQTVGEGASEAAGQLAGRGTVDTGDIFNEMAAGLGMSAGETVLGANIRQMSGIDDGAIKEAAAASVAEKEAQIDAINGAARDLKLSQRNPSALREFVNKIMPNQSVFVDGNAAKEFFQSLPPEKQAEIAGVMPDIVERIREAVATGADVEISGSDYFAHLAPMTESDYLKSFIRFGDEDFSIDQLSRVDDLVAAAQEDFDIPDNQDLQLGEAVQRKLEQQLQNAGRSLESAKMESQLARANVETLIERYGDSEKAYEIISDAYNKLSVRGVEQRRFLRSKIDNLDFLIDSARAQVNGEKRRETMPVEKKYPVLNYLKKNGGVRIGSPLAAELEAIGVTRDTMVGLFKRGNGRVLGIFGTQGQESDIDNIPASEWALSDAPPQDGNGYVDKAFILESVRGELAGKPLRTVDSMKELPDEDILLEHLNQLGIDISTATNEDIKRSLNEGAAREALAEELFQAVYGQEGKRGSVQFLPDGETVINIFEDADLTTVLHEMGHFYWNLLVRLDEAGSLNEQGKADVQAMRDFVEAEDGAKLNVEQEEKIARAFEAYLMEGKAPSVDLQNAFQRFKAWMTRIYKTVKGLNVSINDDVRAVFDRMLASDEAINAVRDNRLFRADNDVLSILDKQQGQAYLKQGERAAQRAKEKLFRRILKQHERTQTQWWKDEREKLRKEIEAQVNNSAVYKLLDSMQKGQLPDGTPLGEPVRLSRKMLKEQFGEEVLAYMPRATVAQSGGYDPNIVAEMFGFKSADSMVKAVINAEDKKQKVERLIDNEMLARHGDALRDGTLERAAMDDFTNEQLAVQYGIELKAVSEKAGMAYAKPEEFRAAAEKILSGKRVDEVNKSSRYYYAALRAARDFGRYSRAGNWVKAADAKRKQLLNHYLYRLSQDAEAEVTSALKRFKKLEKPPVAGKVKIDEDYHNKIREVLAAFNFMPRISAQRALKLEIIAFNRWIEEKKTNDEALLEFPLEMLRASDKQHYRDLTLEEFRAVRDMVYNIEMQGRRKLEYMINGQKRELQAVIDDVLLTVEKALPVRDMPMNKTPGQELAEKFLTIQIKPREYFRQLDDGNELGILHQAIMKPIDDGINRYTTREREAGDTIKRLIESAYTHQELRSIMRDKFEVKGLGNDITKENLLMMALNWGNQGNREALIHGYQARGWDYDTIEKALFKSLDKRDWDFVQGVFDWINSYWPEISKLEKERKGFTPAKVEAAPIDTPFGRFRGGYFPIVADPSKSNISNAQTLDEMLTDMKAGMFSGAATRRNHTKARVGVGLEARPILLQFDTISRHVNMVLRDLELSEAVFNASKLLKNTSVRQAISQRIGVEGYNTIDLWLKDIAVGNMVSRDFASILLNKLRANGTIAYLGFSLGTFVQQGTGVIQAASVLGKGGKGWKWALKGFSALRKAYTEGAGLNISEIHNMSEFMRNRHETMNININEALNIGKGLAPDKLSRAYEQYAPERLQQLTDKIPPDYRKWFLWHIQKAQMLVDAGVWLGAYEKTITEGGGEADAVTYADSVVRRSQASGLIQDLSGIERGTVSATQRQSSAYKTAFTFMFSYFNSKFNVSYGKVADFKAGRISKGELAVDMINIIWLESLVTAIIMQNFPTGDDDDLEEATKSWAWWFISQPAQQVIFGRELASAAQGFASGGGALGPLLKSTASLSNQVSQGEADTALLKSAIGFAGVAIGIPSTQINRFINVIERADNGEEVGYIDFIRARKPDEK